jgi:biopolymer transport protein ExbD
MGTHALTSQDQPILDLNTTPLIDVMLVLLVMLIITIPIQSHAIKLDLPTACADCPKPNTLKNEIGITASGAILWNDRPITREGLKYDLQLTKGMKPQPELHLRPDPRARYEVVDDVLGIIKRAQVKKFGFVDNERYANW